MKISISNIFYNPVIVIFAFICAALALTSCAPQSEVDDLKAQLEALKNPQGTINPTPPINNTPVPPTVIYTPAPTPPALSIPTYGPGNGNNTFTASSGTLSIQTNSANGKLCLRANASQTATCLVEIPNGSSGISYWNRTQVGNYVWYEVSYGSFTGYLRGDYVSI